MRSIGYNSTRAVREAYRKFQINWKTRYENCPDLPMKFLKPVTEFKKLMMKQEQGEVEEAQDVWTKNMADPV